MPNLKKYAESLIANSLGASKVVFKFGLPPVEITFDKTEFAAMLRSSEIASRTVAECFVERRAFWEDAYGENFEYVIRSLEQVEPALKAFDRDLSGSNDLAAIGYARLVRAWAQRTVETRKQLIDRLGEIDAEKAADPYYDSAWHDRDEAMINSLIDLRVRIYPLVKTLLDLIEDGDPIKEMAIEKMERGLKRLSPRQIQNLDPEIEPVT